MRLQEPARRSESKTGPALPGVGTAPARGTLVASRRGAGAVGLDSKGGELCLSRAKPKETLVEARSDPDVQKSVVKPEHWGERLLKLLRIASAHRSWLYPVKRMTRRIWDKKSRTFKL